MVTGKQWPGKRVRVQGPDNHHSTDTDSPHRDPGRSLRSWTRHTLHRPHTDPAHDDQARRAASEAPRSTQRPESAAAALIWRAPAPGGAEAMSTCPAALSANRTSLHGPGTDSARSRLG